MTALSAAQSIWRRVLPGSLRRQAAPLLVRAAQAYVRASPRPKTPAATDLPIKVVGLFSGAHGVAASARLCVRAFEALGVPVESIDAGRGEIDLRRRLSKTTPAAAWIFHLNPPELIPALASLGPGRIAGPRYGYWAWELPRAPAAWLRAADLVDEIWAPSHYTAQAFKGARAPTRVTPHPLFVADYSGIAPSPRESAFEVVSLFDFNSSVARKNPFGAISAFRRAFGDDPACRLTLKTQNGDRFPDLLAALAAQGGANIRVVDGAWPYEDIKALIVGADALVSLHRAEGFGLTIAEAMALGTPVVATGFSGPLDFTGENGALLVPYQLIAVEDGQSIYRDQVWAEPDTTVAAEHLRRLRHDPQLADRLRRTGLVIVRERLSPEAWVKTLPQAVQDAASRLSGRKGP